MLVYKNGYAMGALVLQFCFYGSDVRAQGRENLFPLLQLFKSVPHVLHFRLKVLQTSVSIVQQTVLNAKHTRHVLLHHLQVLFTVTGLEYMQIIILMGNIIFVSSQCIKHLEIRVIAMSVAS